MSTRNGKRNMVRTNTLRSATQKPPMQNPPDPEIYNILLTAGRNGRRKRQLTSMSVMQMQASGIGGLPPCTASAVLGPGFTVENLPVLAPAAANVYCSGGNLAGSPYSAASSRSPASVALIGG
jgi:hypothetical protein